MENYNDQLLSIGWRIVVTIIIVLIVITSFIDGSLVIGVSALAPFLWVLYMTWKKYLN